MPCGCLSYNPAKVMNSIRCRLIKAKLCPLSEVATFKKETHEEIKLRRTKSGREKAKGKKGRKQNRKVKKEGRSEKRDPRLGRKQPS